MWNDVKHGRIIAHSISTIFVFTCLKAAWPEVLIPNIYRAHSTLPSSDPFLPEKLNWTTSFQVLVPTVKMSVDMMDSRSTSLTSFHICKDEHKMLKYAHQILSLHPWVDHMLLRSKIHSILVQNKSHCEARKSFLHLKRAVFWFFHSVTTL